MKLPRVLDDILKACVVVVIVLQGTVKSPRVLDDKFEACVVVVIVTVVIVIESFQVNEHERMF